MRMSRLFVLAVLGVFQAVPLARAESDISAWSAECGPTRPMSPNKCRVARYLDEDSGLGAIMFSFIDQELNFLIFGNGIFNQAEIKIDDKEIFFTMLCGQGYCLFSGRVAEKLARLFRTGRSAEIEVATLSFGNVLNHEFDLEGFGDSFARARPERRATQPSMVL